MKQLHFGGWAPSNGNGQRSKRAPGRPRSEHARQSILRSTLRLLRQTGFADLCIEAIAADAGVGKATVYRWWPNKVALVVDAFFCSAAEDLRFPDTGSVRSDMRLQLNGVARVYRGQRGRLLAALIGGGQSDPELIKAFRERFMRPRRQEAYATLRRGISRGELPEGLDLDMILDSLYGPLLLRLLLRHSALTEEFVNQVCELVMDGVTNSGRQARKARDSA